MSTFNRTTLVKVLEILDSGHAGEALAAAKLASTMVREAGLTWDDVLAPAIEGRGATLPTIATHATSAGPFGYRRDRELSPHPVAKRSGRLIWVKDGWTLLETMPI